MISQVIGFWPGLQCHTQTPFCGAGLSSNQKMTGYSHSHQATIAPEAVTFGAVQYSRVQSPTLEKTIFSSGSLRGTFQHRESQPAGREFPEQLETDFWMFCNQSVRVPQSPEEGAGPPGAGVAASCEPREVGAGN